MPTPTLALGLVQMALEKELAANRDKMVRFIGQARAAGCRVVVFPESCLSSPPETLQAEIDDAIAALAAAARAQALYVILGLKCRRPNAAEGHCDALLVIAPDGRILQRYYKLFDVRPNKAPGIFYLDGIPCSAALCADRWIRSVEDLPAIQGAQILFECSCNWAREWVPDLGWYWYVPRALRNGAYVVFTNTAASAQDTTPEEKRVGHGHSAVIAPDGRLVITADERADQLLLATLDLGLATREEAQRRSAHPAFAPFWRAGCRIMAGEAVEEPAHVALTSPSLPITLAVAQMACSQDVAENVARMQRLLCAAHTLGAELVVFPELAVTGARDEDILQAQPEALAAALDALRATARTEGLYAVLGMPDFADGRWQNCAWVLSPEGTVLTRYAQLVVDRPDLFQAGTSSRAMWFWVKGLPAVVTLGYHEALWSEVAELAALRGAQIHVHLGYYQALTACAAQRHKQLAVNLASYRTLTAVVNAASPEGLARPSAPANGGSTLWEDGRHHRGSGPYPYSAVLLGQAGPGEQLLAVTHTIGGANPHFERLAHHLDAPMRAWYALGAEIIAGETPRG